LSNDYKKFLADAAKPVSLRCEKRDSTYSQGGSCYYCRTGYEPKDMGKDSMPMLDRARLRTAGPSKNFGGMEVHDASQSSPSPRHVFRSDRAPHHKFRRGVSLKAKRCLKSS